MDTAVSTTVSTTGSTGASDLAGKAGADLPTLSAEELHLYLLKAFTVGNRAKRKLIDGLLHLHESRFYLLLGYSSICAERMLETDAAPPSLPCKGRNTPRLRRRVLLRD